MQNIIFTIYKGIIFHEKMILTLISLTDRCTEVFCTSFLFYINMFNIYNLNKKYLIAETKINFVS